MQSIRNTMILALVTIASLSGCGIAVESGSDQTGVIFEVQDTVEYSIHRIDEYGYVEQRLSSGCIYLSPGEEKSILVEDDEVFADYEFLYRVRGEHLVVSITEDGSSLHRSYHRQDLFAGGYAVEQNVVTGLGITYLMTLEDTGCL